MQSLSNVDCLKMSLKRNRPLKRTPKMPLYWYKEVFEINIDVH